ncbi:MAG: ABC transporter ATP-binding protein [Eubacterium sp.]|nr:ABC transporter ATP-binding protein [Eubacterium sp.]
MIEIRDLTKKFGDFTAVDHLSLTINTGEFFGLLGPNGAGKTTTISMISTVLLPNSGEVLVNGEPLTRKSSAIKRKISVITQEYSLRMDMTCDEVMEYQGRLYYMPLKEIRQKTDELLDFVGLKDFRKRSVRNLSGGLKRRLMICRALMTEPEIILLDEPTAGMDAIARRQTWGILKELQKKNITIILTTHYMEEAEALCDRVALIDSGKLSYIDTPRGLIDDLGRYAVDKTVDGKLESRYFADRQEAIDYLTSEEDADMRNTTLEDVFIQRIGKVLMKK